jgi:transcriptional regulator with GAF, ATPase, and Fis domain
MPSLIFAGRSQPLVRKLSSVGADPENDVVVQGPGVAATHAHVRLEDGRFVLVALDHRAHPVLVNGKAIKKHALEHGDAVLLGKTALKFHLWDDRTTIEREAGPAIDELQAYRRLAAFSDHLARRIGVDELLEALLDEVVGLTGADKGFLLIMRDGEPRVCTARNLNKESIAASLDHVSDSIINRVLESREPLIVSDALNDAAFNASISVMQLRLCSVMCVPLLFQGNLLGVIYVGNDNVVNLFEPRSLELLTVFASQAALLLQHAMQVQALRAETAELRLDLDRQKFGEIIGACDVMREVFRKVEKIAVTDIGVLILGETGTGKELIAREIHRRSRRKGAPFVAINCSAIPESLMESELFGHRKGAFTGAVENKPGSFQAAHGGTLFLDEIGDMPPNLQVKLLRAIQERVVTSVGDTRPTPVDIRVVAATHVNLEEAIKQGRFREDLYYRLNVVSIELPPLRARDEDVVLIAKFLLEKFAKEYGRPIQGFTREAIIALRKHAWPGNIRELENRIKKGVVLADDLQLSPRDLDLSDEVLVGRVLALAEAKEAFQRRYIDEVLALNGGNRTKTARDLGVDPRTIFRHLAITRGELEPDGD